MLAVEFPFPADIWGTVSDWMMIGVTAITAIFLYRTLRSQQQVQQSQNELLRIEQIRIREQFKPDLKYSRYDDGNLAKGIKEEDMKGKQLISFAVKNYSENNALEVDLIFKPTKEIVPIYISPFRNLIQGGEYLSINFIVNAFKGNLFIYNFQFSLTYKDVAGIKYKQDVFCYKNSNEEKIIPSVPVVIS